MGTSTASEGKAFASLGPMLLARKGTAKPAMRVQLDQSDRVAQLGDDFEELACSQDELGWNDMGDSVVSLPVTNRRAKQAEVTPAPKVKRVAFTLRLDAERHTKLRLASTLAGESAQKLMTSALDALLADMPEIDTLAAQMRRKAKLS
ncbi:MAG: hypothetical protein WBA68_03375 [Alteraurantiacibacter sp.]